MDIGTVRSVASRARTRNTRVSACCSRRARVNQDLPTIRPTVFGSRRVVPGRVQWHVREHTVPLSRARRVCWKRERSIREFNRPILLMWSLPVWILLRGTQTECNSLVNWKKNCTTNHLFMYYDLWAMILIYRCKRKQSYRLWIEVKIVWTCR